MIWHIKIDSHPLHVVGEDGYRSIVMYFTLPARNSKSSRYLELKHIALGQAVGEITLAISSHYFQLTTICSQLISLLFSLVFSTLQYFLGFLLSVSTAITSTTEKSQRLPSSSQATLISCSLKNRMDTLWGGFLLSAMIIPPLFRLM